MAYFARELGYPITIIMPENMSEERKKIITVLGAKMILCSEGNFAEAAEIRDEMAKDPNFFNPDQFSNPMNIDCHYETTAGEIIEQMRPHSERINAFVAGVGTGGTLIGVSKRLMEVFPDCKCIAVEPSESPVMSGGDPGIHGIQGIGDGFIPAIASDGKDGLNSNIDEVISVSTEESKRAAMYLSQEKGICVGISSGANYLAAMEMREKYGTTVTVFADGYTKYKSQGLTGNVRGKCLFHKECNCPIQEICPRKEDEGHCDAFNLDC
jgi:cysteine synthase A